MVRHKTTEKVTIFNNVLTIYSKAITLLKNRNINKFRNLPFIVNIEKQFVDILTVYT